VYSDLSNLYGTVKQDTATVNNELNKRVTDSVKSPSIDRVTVSVNIDGKWTINYDADKNPIINPDGSIDRSYTALTADEISSATSLVQNAIGYSSSRGDAVTVTNIAFDRTLEFEEADRKLAQTRQMQLILVIFLASIAGILLIFMAVRLVGREMERRRRMREEELARQQEEARQRALLEEENQGLEVSMSVEERHRMELLENAQAAAKEHAPDVAQLIRTWLLEE
jgi:flagellar M-ring protein FliF